METPTLKRRPAWSSVWEEAVLRVWRMIHRLAILLLDGCFLAIWAAIELAIGYGLKSLDAPSVVMAAYWVGTFVTGIWVATYCVLDLLDDLGVYVDDPKGGAA